MTISLRFVLVFTLVVVLGACGGEPADVSGEYSVALTYDANGCAIEGWTEGDSLSGIPVTIAQEGAEVSAEVGGLIAVFLDFGFGSNVYEGTVDGSSIDLDLFGTIPLQDGNCTYTINSSIDATLQGDSLVGEIRYTAATNDNPDCASVDGCVSVQRFNGNRPPQ